MSTDIVEKVRNNFFIKVLYTLFIYIYRESCLNICNTEGD